MTKISRRALLATAAALGATAAFAKAPAKSRSAWREARALFPEGVASGDPDSTSVHSVDPPAGYRRRARHVPLIVEVAEDRDFQRVVANAKANALEESDWTARVLVGGLKPATEYWYRFTDADGNGSRIGRTITAPADDDPRRVNFAFVSCQNANYGAQNAYRRMIYRRPARGAGRQARLRAASGRLHLRAGLVSGRARQRRVLRSQSPRHRAL